MQKNITFFSLSDMEFIRTSRNFYHRVQRIEAPKVPEKLQNFMKYRCNKFSNNLCSSGCTCQIQLMCTQSFSFQSDKHSYSAPPQPSLFSNPVEINAHISLDHLQLFISSSEHRPSTHVCTYVCTCAQTQCTRTYVRTLQQLLLDSKTI